MKGNRGLTLIELVIVLAIIAIIGAILVPNFMNTTDKARLKSDVQSARIITNAIGLYKAEQSKAISSSDIAGVIDELESKGYIEAEHTDIQTENAAWQYDPVTGEVVVNIGGCDESIKKNVFNQLSEQEKKYVRGGM